MKLSRKEKTVKRAGSLFSYRTVKMGLVEEGSKGMSLCYGLLCTCPPQAQLPVNPGESEHLAFLHLGARSLALPLQRLPHRPGRRERRCQITRTWRARS